MRSPWVREPENKGFECWGCFVEGKLAAYAHCIPLEDMVNLSGMISDPAMLKARPNNAMIYTLTRYYLRERKFRYVTDGTRVVHHSTQIQDVLEDMGYRRIFCPLRLEALPLARLLLRSRIDTWGRWLGLERVVPAPMDKLKAAAMLVRIATSCRSMPTCQTTS